MLVGVRLLVDVGRSDLLASSTPPTQGVLVATEHKSVLDKGQGRLVFE